MCIDCGTDAKIESEQIEDPARPGTYKTVQYCSYCGEVQ